MTPYIGTSGFYYNDWKDTFYPEDLAKKDWLPFYSKHFETVEINNTFYNTPQKSTFEKWRENTPVNFRFTLKGSRYVTHIKKLSEPKEGVTNFYKAIEPLTEKTDCVLWQLPPNLHFNAQKLKGFASSCSSNYANIMEFRHRSWFTDECYDILREYQLGVSMLSTSDDFPEEIMHTGHTAYLRFHGKDKKQRYRYLYSKEELQQWAERIKSLNPHRIFIYFNNDFEGNAIKNARQMKEMLD